MDAAKLAFDISAVSTGSAPRSPGPSESGVAALSGPRNIAASWHEHSGSVPIALTNYANANIASAEAYLRALKK